MKYLAITSLFLGSFLFITPAFTQGSTPTAPDSTLSADSEAATETATKETKLKIAEVDFKNPLGNKSDARYVIGVIVKALLGISGSLALIMFIYGGLLWMTSGGEPDKIKKGQETLIWAAVGLILLFSAYAITKLVINALQGVTG